MASNDTDDAIPEDDGVSILDRRTTYQGFFRIDRYRLRHRLFGGGWSDAIDREVFERGHAVAVILYDPVADALVFTEQFRMGALAARRSRRFPAGVPPWLVEICAGIIDPGESDEAVARREVREETGCEVIDIFPVMRYLVSPGGSSETVQLFCARVEVPRDGAVHGLDHEGEDIRVKVMPAAEALSWLERPDGQNVMTIAALQWFQLHRDDLRRRWSR